MLHDLLIHHLVIEFHWILLCEVIVNLTLLWLDHVGSARVNGVRQRVVLPADLTLLHLFVKDRLVVPSSFLLIHKTAGR